MTIQTNSRKGKPVLVAAALFAIVMAAGCSLPKQQTGAHDHEHGGGAEADDHDHDHGEGNESLSVWTDDLELFTEFPPLETGAPQDFLLHLTHVRTGLPVTEKVSFRAAPAGGGPEFSGEAAPRRSGIYTISPAFATAGEWRIALDVSVEDGAQTIVMEGLDVQSPGGERDHGHEEGPANTISFTKEQQWVVPVVTVPADRGPVVERHRLAAWVVPTPDTQNMAAAPLGGVLRTEGMPSFPRIGDAVEAGQPLAWVDSAAMSAESLARDANTQGRQSLTVDLDTRAAEAAGEADRARALVAQHERALKRAADLLEARAGSQRDVDAARSALDEARAMLRAAERVAESVRAARSGVGVPASPAPPETRPVVFAPITGRVTRVHAGPGTLVDAGAPVLTITGLGTVLVEARAPESLIPALANPPSGMLELPGEGGVLRAVVPAAGAPGPWMAPKVDPETRTAPLFFHVDNAEGRLAVGMSLSVWADGRGVEDAVRIPATAVVDENGIATAYVMLEGESFQKRNVRLGVRDGVVVEVLDGVAAGERVVSQGAYLVRLASVAGSGLGSAHVH